VIGKCTTSREAIKELVEQESKPLALLRPIGGKEEFMTLLGRKLTEKWLGKGDIWETSADLRGVSTRGKEGIRS